MKPRILALYLPQYHPIPENDEWWGKGFTEWTNVGKAQALWRGHKQPRVPADLGYYDLRLPEVREQQAELAHEAGIEAFCYWHYWFGNGRRLLERPFNEVLESGKPDFPFCLAWANHSWRAKAWDKDQKKDKVLVEQTYPGKEDARLHFEFLLKAFRDPRYVRIDGRPFFMIYDVNALPQQYIEWFRQWSREAGLPGLYLVANVYDTLEPKETYLSMGYDAVRYNRGVAVFTEQLATMNTAEKFCYLAGRRVKQWLTGRPRGAMDYSMNYKRFTPPMTRQSTVYQACCRNGITRHAVKRRRRAYTIMPSHAISTNMRAEHSNLLKKNHRNIN